MPSVRGLYDPQWEHDACGIGAVVDISGRRSHAIVEHGKQVLLNLMHRGAAGADESTGDGAGILLQIPDEFLRTEAERLGFSLPPQGHYGVGVFFLPHETELRRACEQTLAAEAEAEGLGLLGWRDVPTDNRCLGELARASEPVIRQAFFNGRGRKDEDLERRLYVVRKRSERRVREMLGDRAEQFYVPSMSGRTLLYKGMFLAPQLFAYYPDLADGRRANGLGHRPPALQHEHVSELAAGPAVPHDRPQRRDQHVAGQRQPHSRPRQLDGRRRR